MDACSFGNLTFSPLLALNSGDPILPADGVYEVEVYTTSNDTTALREATTDKLNTDFPIHRSLMSRGVN